MNYRRLSLVIGVATLAAGVVAIVAPGSVPLSPGRVIVTLIGVLALLQALRVIQRRRHGRHNEATTPDPERAGSAPTFGDDLEGVLAPFLNRRRVPLQVRKVRDGLTAVAVAVLTQFEGLTEAEANERIAAGSWTTDRYAASFLGGADAPSLSLRTRLRTRVARESRTQRAIRRTVDGLEAVIERRVGSTDGVANNPQSQDVDGVTGSDVDSSRRVSTNRSYTFDEGADELVRRKAHSTGHWRGVSVIALVGIGVGIIVEQPAVLLAGVVGVGYAAYARSPVFPPRSVAVERTLSTETPAAGEEVTVTVTVTNTSDRVLADIRVVDGVPEALSVESGSPRHGSVLRPTASASFTYTVTGRRGVHEFGPTHVIGRSLTGGTEEERLHASNTTLTCIPTLTAASEPVPLRQKATQFVGREKTPTTGAGVEFSATRKYRPGDPMGRIDWNRRARTRELTTVEFRAERAATVVLLVDARPAAYVASPSRDGHAVDRAVEAAGQLFSTLEASGNRVGVAAAGTDACWLPPDTGVDHRAAVRELLAVDPAFTPVPKDDGAVDWRWAQTLRSRLEPGTQVVFLSPLTDETATQVARQFDAHGFPVTVVSPDPTAQLSPSHRLGRIARQVHISSLRGAGIPVVDWAWTEPLDTALARYDERGST